MKKAIIGISALLITAFIVILAVNAQDKPQETKKCSTETSKDCSKGPQSSACCGMKYGNSAETKCCGQAQASEAACDHSKHKEGQCIHEGCKGSTASASGEAKKCCQSDHKEGSQNQ